MTVLHRLSTKRRPMRLVKRQQGFSMIEALIAFAVLSFGIMGVVTLLASSKANQLETVQRTRAVTLANALVERIRINPAAVATYHTGLNAPVTGVSGTAPSPDCKSAPCTPVQLATYDMWEWSEELRGANATVTATGNAIGGIFQPQACVVFAADAGRTATGPLTVLITWRGVSEITDATAGGDECGNLNAEDEPYRRQVAVQTYLVDGTEL